MYRKFYPIAAAPFWAKVGKNDAFSGEIIRFGENLSLFQKKEGNDTYAAPMYLHSFKFIAPRTVSEAKKFTLGFFETEKIKTVADKLRYYRYRKGLLQADVADYLGMDKGTYIDYENQSRDYYSAEIMEKLAELFEVNVYELLDDYNKFLYDGQGRNIIKLREKLNITQEELAERMGISLQKVKRWEKDEVRMFRFTWEKFYSFCIKNQ